MFKVYDKNNNEINCKVIFTFEKNNKNFVVYYDDEEDILASYYKLENDKAIIYPITDEIDFDLIDEELKKRMNNNE